MKSVKQAFGFLFFAASIMLMASPAKAQIVQQPASINYIGSNLWATWVNVNFPQGSANVYNFSLPAANTNTMLATLLTAQSSNKTVLVQVDTGYTDWSPLVGVCSFTN